MEGAVAIVKATRNDDVNIEAGCDVGGLVPDGLKITAGHRYELPALLFEFVFWDV